MLPSHPSVRQRSSASTSGSRSPSQNQLSSSTVYGRKPDWGWDYAFLFAVDEALEQQYASSPRARTPSADVAVPVGEGDTHLVGCDVPDEAAVPDSSASRIRILSRLRCAGFVFSQLYSRSEKVILVRFSLPPHTMKRKAELLGMEFQLKEKFGGGYLAFADERSSCYINDDLEASTGAYFCPSDRTLIILRTLQSKEDWGCDLNIEKMVFKKELQQAFAIHSPPDQDALVHSAVWARLWDPTWTPPFRAMKDYLGARVALYFAYVSFYARKLLSIALLSIPVFIALRYIPSVRVKDILKWFFSVALVLWTTYFLESWKRRNAALVLDWGLNDYHTDAADETRPQFKGELRYGFYCAGGFIPLADIVEFEAAAQVHRSTSGNGDTCSRDGAVGVTNLPCNPFEDVRTSRRRRTQSAFITLVFIGIVAGLTFLLLHFRNRIVCIGMGFDDLQCKCYYSTTCVPNETLLPSNVATALPGILNGVLITVFDSIWRWVSLALTKRENHRTDQMFEDSLVYKRFAFQFISNCKSAYLPQQTCDFLEFMNDAELTHKSLTLLLAIVFPDLSLFYIAFVKKYTGRGCRLRRNSLTKVQEQDCIGELESQMISLVLTKATIQQVMEIGLPFMTSSIRKWNARRRAKREAPRAPGIPDSALKTTSGASRYFQESKLPAYHSTIEDYAELIIQFGYLVLFGVAFPLAAVVNLINNLVETRTDAFKILQLSQRVNADDAADIGAWYPILETLNVLAVATNAGLLVFTADTGNNLFWGGKRFPSVYQVLLFFFMWHTLLGVKAIAAFAKSDTPDATKRKFARQRYDIARFFNVGWQDAFRGTSLLNVNEEEVKLCNKYADLFDSASDDDSNSDSSHLSNSHGRSKAEASS